LIGEGGVLRTGGAPDRHRMALDRRLSETMGARRCRLPGIGAWKSSDENAAARPFTMEFAEPVPAVFLKRKARHLSSSSSVVSVDVHG
jgi:hypothetical protein